MARGLVVVAGLSAMLLGGCDQGMDTIGPQGGTVVSPDGRLVLEIPAGALAHDVTVSIGEVDDAPQGAVAQAYEIEPHLLQLDLPATLTYDLEASPAGARKLDALGMTPADVELVTEGADSWEPMADRRTDDEAGTVSASVLFFSAYAPIAR